MRRQLTHVQRDCVSSFWETADPSPTAFCDGKGGLHSCISSACSHEGDQWTAYSSRSASLCHEYLSCGSTGTYTYTYQTPSGDWWGGGWRGDKDKSFPTGEVVVTGCPWHGDGWGFPYWGGLGYGNKFWDDMGPGWERATVTTTVHGGGTPQVMVLEEAHSGDVSTIRTVGLEAVETGSSDSDGGDSGAPAVGGQSVLAMGAALGAVIALIGLM